MVNNLLMAAGSFIILFSSWIFGGIIGILIGFMMVLFAIYSGEGESNWQVIHFGLIIILFSSFLFGGAIGITFGLIVMILGAYIPPPSL